MSFWHWLLQSDSGLLVRIGAGAAIFAAFAIVDLRKNGRRATRWREYAFLLVCVLLAMIYGVLNDQITSTISWEYFYYGKDLAEKLGPQTPPDALKLHLAAAIVGLKATWSAGVLIGVAILLANNPSRHLARLSNRTLLQQFPLILIFSIAFAAVGAAAGWLGVFSKWNDDFAQMFARNEWRPRRFMMAYGIHLGGYAGGLLGTIAAIWRIRRQRRIINLAGFKIVVRDRQ